MKKLLYVLVILISVTAKAQKKFAVDSIGKQINLYGLKNQSPLLFIHFDKNVYSNNENVWFTAYLFGADFQKYKTLSVALVKDDSRAVLMEDRFVINNGLAFGNTFVPDSVGPGNYTFIATTNLLVNGKPDVIFSQPVTIKTEDKQGYTASLNPIDTSITVAQQKVMLLVNFINEPDPPLAVPASYYVGNAASPVLKGAIQTKAGQYIFNVPSKLLSPGNNQLHVQIKYNKEVKDISIVLPLPPQPAVVRFYPEGGNLVNNTRSVVGWEVKSAAGNPMGVSAILYRDKTILDTIETNSYGLGRFTLTPAAGSSYYIKLYANKKDTLYKLPTALPNGPVISITNALADDTLTVNIKDGQHEKLYLTVHNYMQLYFSGPVNMATTTRSIKFILNDVPKGLTQLTVTDSLGRPFAERIFFAHYDRRAPLLITTDENEYATRKKVTVKLKLDSKADSGFVSVACVQENRIDLKKNNDIESYFYLKRDLEDIPVKENYLGSSEGDKQFLENILLIKGWNRYTWLDLLKTEPADTVRKFDELVFKGSVMQNSVSMGNFTKYNLLKKPVSLINLLRPINPVITGNTGIFTLTDDDLITEAEKKVTLFIVNSQPNEYRIQVTDPFTGINEKLSKQLPVNDYSTAGQESTHYMQVADNEHVIHLKEVKITDKNDDTFFGKKGGPGANACGDYVCRYNILNCSNHRNAGDNRQPIIGQTYTGSNGPYHGCTAELRNDNVIKFKGIYTAQEFYPADYSQVNPSQPEYLSTIYWKHQLKISSAKETEFSFYTGDITGRFKIVVQGVTANDITYGEKSFNVTKGK